MTESERLAAIEAIRQVKSRYFRGVDSGDGELVRSILAEECELDYRGCCTDPISGQDFLPSMNVVLRGRKSWLSGALANTGIVSVHQGNDPDITITSETTASGIWSFTDRFFVASGSPFSTLTGWGHYHETYEKVGDEWKLKTTRITRLRVEVS